MDIYMPSKMEHLVSGLIDLFGIREKRAVFEIRLLTEHVFDAGTMHFTAFPTDHTETSIGLVIEDGKDKLVYTCDTRPLTDAPPFMKDARILIHEASGLLKDEEILPSKLTGYLTCLLRREYFIYNITGFIHRCSQPA